MLSIAANVPAEFEIPVQEECQKFIEKWKKLTFGFFVRVIWGGRGGVYPFVCVRVCANDGIRNIP